MAAFLFHCSIKTVYTYLHITGTYDKWVEDFL